MPTAAENKTAKNSHGGFAGRSIIERLEIQMDKRRKVLERKRTEQGVAEMPHSEHSYETALWTQAVEKGRYEGLAAALALLRNSTVPQEVSRSNERLGIE